MEFSIDENDNVTYRIIPITASNACTAVDASGYSYVEGISENVAVGENGVINERN